jgi:mannose-1-phosphate guanylyltransferase
VLPGARVGADAVVEGSVVMAGASVGAGCRVRSSAVGPDATLDEEVLLEHAVVGEGAHIGRRNELRRGARAACDLVLQPEAIRF